MEVNKDLHSLLSFQVRVAAFHFSYLYHHHMLRQRISRMGIDIDACAAPEFSHINHLPHLHGVMRWNNWNGGDKFFISQPELSDLWQKIHGAFRVYLKALKSDYISEMKVAYAVKDERLMVVKHEFKEYPESSKVGYRVSTTRGWLPKNCEIVNKLLKKGANWAINHGVEPDVKEIWSKVDISFKNWAKGLPTIPMRIRENETFLIREQEVCLLSGGVYEILEYGVMVGVVKEIKKFSVVNVNKLY